MTSPLYVLCLALHVIKYGWLTVTVQVQCQRVSKVQAPSLRCITWPCSPLFQSHDVIGLHMDPILVLLHYSPGCRFHPISERQRRLQWSMACSPNPFVLYQTVLNSGTGASAEQYENAFDKSIMAPSCITERAPNSIVFRLHFTLLY